MEIWQAIILAIVEGISEFLPISSTGHLVLTSYVINVSQTEFVKTFEIFIQLGAVLAVLFFYGKTLLTKINLWKKLILAFLPTAVFGLVFYSFIKNYLLGNTWVTVIALFLGGLVLILIEKNYHKKNQISSLNSLSGLNSLTYKQAFFIGLFQSVSMIPGVSRAAATIIGGLMMGLDRKAAVEFSFLLAIPTVLAATALDLIKTDLHPTNSELLVSAVGFVTAFFVALLTIKFLLKYIQKNNFIPFGIYRIILAVLFALIFLH